MSKKLINEIFEYYSIHRALEYSREHDSILIIYGQYLIPLIAIEVSYL
jgi:hypothetical protein